MPTTSPNISGRLGEEKGRATGAWRLMLFMLFVFLVFLTSYFGLVFGYQNYVEAQIQRKNQEIEALATQVPREEQDKFLKFQFQLINLQNLLNRHVSISTFFDLLESNTNSQVHYLDLDLNVVERRVNLRGQATSYEILGEQLSAYERLREIVRYSLNQARLGEGGRVTFDVALFLSPDIFQSVTQ